MDFDKVEHLKKLKQDNANANTKLWSNGKRLISSVFNLVSSIPDELGLSELVEKVGESLSSMCDLALDVAEKYFITKALKDIDQIKTIAPDQSNDNNAMIAQWYERNPDMQQYASPEFRKPHYPKFMRKPF